MNLAQDAGGPARSSSHRPAWLSSAFARFAGKLDPRTAARVPVLLLGALFACGRRTVTFWSRAGGITTEFRPRRDKRMPPGWSTRPGARVSAGAASSTEWANHGSFAFPPFQELGHFALARRTPLVHNKTCGPR